MSNEAIISQMKSKISGLSLKNLKKIATESSENLDVPCSVVNVIFDVLMERMPEKEFIEFCDAL